MQFLAGVQLLFIQWIEVARGTLCRNAVTDPLDTRVLGCFCERIL